MEVTIVVPAFERPEHLRQTLEVIHQQRLPFNSEIIVVDDGGEPGIKEVAGTLPVRYYRLDRPATWKNPSRAINVGLRRAQGMVTIINHSGIVARTNAIDQIYRAVLDNPYSAILARIEESGYETNGSFRDYFLLGGMMTAQFQAIRGYDEDFTEYGYEDDDLAMRLIWRGITFQHRSEILGDHLVHGRHDLTPGMERMRRLHYKKMEDLRNDGKTVLVIRNLDREWGQL